MAVVVAVGIVVIGTRYAARWFLLIRGEEGGWRKINDAGYQQLREPLMHGVQSTLHGHLVCESLVHLPSFRLQKWQKFADDSYIKNIFGPQDMVSVVGHG